MKYLYVKIGKIKKSNINLFVFPCFPNSMSIKEMREKWGENAYIIKTAKNSYNVDEKTFNYFKNLNRFVLK